MGTLDMGRRKGRFAEGWSSKQAEGVRTNKRKSIYVTETQLTLGPWEMGFK